MNVLRARTGPSQGVRGVGHGPNELAGDPSHRRQRSFEHPRGLGELAFELGVPRVGLTLQRLDLVAEVGLERARAALFGLEGRAFPNDRLAPDVTGLPRRGLVADAATEGDDRFDMRVLPGSIALRRSIMT